MIKLKKIKLINYCGFRDFEVDFSEDNRIRQWTVLAGPNGSFKSTFLNAIRLISSPWQMSSREDLTLFFRRQTYHPNYLPSYVGYIDHKNDMEIVATFLVNEEEKEVIVRNTGEKETTGVVKSEFPDDVFSAAWYVDADNPANHQKFQLIDEHKKEFLDIAKNVYDFECELVDDKINIVSEYDSQRDEYIKYITDFILIKHGTRVHYKSFSAGEKKIATMLTTLLNNVYKNEIKGNDILLIDNIAMHIYYKRHMKLVEKLSEYFSDHQFIITTHSPVIINEMEERYLIDMEKI